MMESGRLTPLRSESLPPTSTRTTIFCLLASVATRQILPSSSSSVWPACTPSKISGCGRCTRLASPRRGIGVERESGAVVEHGGAAGEARPAASAPQIDQDADRPGVIPSRPCGSRRRAPAFCRAGCGSC
jgi:hypothetical protein